MVQGEGVKGAVLRQAQDVALLHEQRQIGRQYAYVKGICQIARLGMGLKV